MNLLETLADVYYKQLNSLFCQLNLHEDPRICIETSRLRRNVWPHQREFKWGFLNLYRLNSQTQLMGNQTTSLSIYYWIRYRFNQLIASTTTRIIWIHCDKSVGLHNISLKLNNNRRDYWRGPLVTFLACSWADVVVWVALREVAADIRALVTRERLSARLSLSHSNTLSHSTHPLSPQPSHRCNLAVYRTIADNMINSIVNKRKKKNNRNIVCRRYWVSFVKLYKHIKILHERHRYR